MAACAQYGGQLSNVVAQLGEAWAADRAKKGARLLSDAVRAGGCLEPEGGRRLLSQAQCAQGQFTLAMVHSRGTHRAAKSFHNPELAHGHAMAALGGGFAPVGVMESFMALQSLVRATLEDPQAVSAATVEVVVAASEAGLKALGGKKHVHAHGTQLQLCGLRVAQRSWKPAIAACKAAAASNPMDLQAAFQLGRAYLGRGSTSQAQRVFRDAERRLGGLCEQLGGCPLLDRVRAGALAQWDAVLRSD